MKVLTANYSDHSNLRDPPPRESRERERGTEKATNYQAGSPHSYGPLGEARLGAKGTIVAAVIRKAKGVLPEPKSGLSTSEPRHYPQISRPEIQDTRCLDPDSGSAPPTATPCPIPKTPNDGLSEMNLSSGTPISGPGPSTHDRDLRSQSHISRPGTRPPGSASVTRLNQDPSPQKTGTRIPLPTRDRIPCP